MPHGIVGFLNPDQPLPFEELFVPLVLTAREKLVARADPDAHGLLTPGAHHGLERYLLNRLSAAGAKAAHCQFQVFKTARSAFNGRQFGRRAKPDSFYMEFVGVHPDARLQKILSEFPGLARLCHILVTNWIDAVIEFIARLKADGNNLSIHFSSTPFQFPIVSLQTGLSDPHRAGRCVVRTIFENGSSLFYKPRSIAAENHFALLISLINEADIPHPLRAAQCWDRGDYGWMEDILPQGCDTEAKVHDFYWRAGALLGLIHLARGVDIHRENLIAAGEFPVLVDLEALWHSLERERDIELNAVRSVLHTGFLPAGKRESGYTYEWGALSRQSLAERSAVIWSHVNSDDMELNEGRRVFEAEAHLPAYTGVAHLAPAFVTDIVAGFQWVGQRFLQDKTNQQKFALWLRDLLKCPRRLILRATGRYNAALDRLTQPDSLRHPQTKIDSIPELTERGKRVLDEEIRALDQFDIPYFENTEPDGFKPDFLMTGNELERGYLDQIPVIIKSMGT